MDRYIMPLRPVNSRQNKAAVSPEIEADRALAGKMLEGDHEALRLWLDSHLAAVFGYLERRLGPGHEATASEVTTATFEHALRRISPYANGSATTPMRLWLLRLAGEQLSKHGKKCGLPAAQTEDLENKQLQHIRRTMESLPPRKQAALALALFEGLSGQELATALGMRLPGAMRLLRSALRDTGKVLGAYMPEQAEER